MNSVNPDRGYEGWLCNTAPETTVTFDPNGGTLGDGEQSKSVQRNGTYGTLPVPKRTGYRFDGWFTDWDGGTKAEETTVVTKGEDHTLYAHWTFIHEHCLCGGDVTVGNHTDHTKVVYKSWNGSDDIQYDSNNTDMSICLRMPLSARILRCRRERHFIFASEVRSIRATV